MAADKTRPVTKPESERGRPASDFPGALRKRRRRVPVTAWVMAVVLLAAGASALVKCRALRGQRMSEHWEFYMGQFAAAPASIFVDLGLAETAPQPERLYNIWIWVQMRMTRPDGLSHRDEAETLWLIEDHVKAEVIRQLGAVYAGRITVDGQRAFVFFASSGDRVDETVQRAMSRFPEYQFHWAGRADPDWSAYFECLSPDELEKLQISSRHVLEALQERGDIHRVPRDVSYFLYFPSPQSRRAFLERARSMGFWVVDEFVSEVDEDTVPFGVQLGKRNPVHLPAILAIEQDLFTAARACGGEYDGWETYVVKRETAEGR